MGTEITFVTTADVRELARVSPSGEITLAPDLNADERLYLARRFREEGIPVPRELERPATA